MQNTQLMYNLTSYLLLNGSLPANDKESSKQDPVLPTFLITSYALASSIKL